MTCKVGGRVLAASVAAFAGPAIASPPPRPGDAVQMSHSSNTATPSCAWPKAPRRPRCASIAQTLYSAAATAPWFPKIRITRSTAMRPSTCALATFMHRLRRPRPPKAGRLRPIPAMRGRGSGADQYVARSRSRPSAQRGRLRSWEGPRRRTRRSGKDRPDRTPSPTSSRESATPAVQMCRTC